MNLFSICLWLLWYSKRLSQSHGFIAKIGFKNGATWPEISSKMFWDMASQTKPPLENRFWLISRARLLRFSNRFLHWTRVIKTVVLTTIKATNRLKKKSQNLAVYLKNGLKNLICGKIWPDRVGALNMRNQFEFPRLHSTFFVLFLSVMNLEIKYL